MKWKEFKQRKSVQIDGWTKIISEATKEVFWLPNETVNDRTGEKFLFVLLLQKLPFASYPHSRKSEPWAWSGSGAAMLERSTMNWWKKMHSAFPHMIGFKIVQFPSSSESWVHHEFVGDKRGTGGPFHPTNSNETKKPVVYEFLSEGKTKRSFIEPKEFEGWNVLEDRHVAGTCASFSGASLICDRKFYWTLPKTL